MFTDCRYRRYMAERPARLSPAALRLTGHVGQIALDRIAASNVAVVAELDQHVAAVRAELAACEQPPATRRVQLTGRTASDEPDSRNCPCCGAPMRRESRPGRGTRAGRHGDRSGLRGGRDGRDANSSRAGRPGDATTAGSPEPGDATCPDVPFVATALHAEATVPLELLLHYASGFVQAALGDGWTPAESADTDDWVSLRLAAICQLIRQAETAATVHPDLRPAVWPRDHDHENFGA
jgi:hypothetical protein